MSVDSLCRDGADMTHPFFHIQWLRAFKHGSYKPFQTHTCTLRVLLYPLRPSKYVKYAATVTYGNWPNGTFVHHLLHLQLNWPSANVAQVILMVLHKTAFRYMRDP